ncbi:MAG: hypothetical protein PHQ96_09420 [Candidatus Omnitrophica bacterium]|nr:hypothetical protein [Candidatus Omnitrophota bacterium]
MKKIIFVMLAFTFIGSLCFAQEAAAPAADPAVPEAAKPVEAKTCTGKIDSITTGDAANNTAPEVAVMDEQGQKLVFVIKDNTVISQSNGEPATLIGLKKDDKVIIMYTTDEKGVNGAQSVQLAD